MKILFTLIFTLLSFSTYAAPKSELWPYWNTSNESNTVQVNHQAWQALLDTYLVVDGENTLFKYSSVTLEDKQKLNAYLTNLSKLNPREFSRAEQYAYWVNLYNAITVQLILDAYPVKSITKLGGFFSFGPWGDEVISINGKALTLNDIEHRILRPIWNDPRTHYAVNCASLGCPNLQPNAFTVDNTEQQLESAAFTFINSDKGVLVDNGKIQLSSIYEWFAEDFGNRQQLTEHLAHYRPDLVTLSGRFHYEYNWDLNDKK
ncbi:DUF547 domain-containing protein [Vibrio sp. SCSIO 43135]|uniref:DUF547 domain-containing protein n=1 Tax=Vibrio sp. SCSIO 43135 TaxID=2819096 RepID=UPI002075AC45|nr:DUF547 domain-containing protein [Vibrio sp. SCSIO 43135]USD40793.1 DUF547 domain-containing protein [Vibrio sp. SCSIO 43135]